MASARRVVLLRYTDDHGVGHFLSACVEIGALADKIGARMIVDFRSHALSKSLKVTAWPPNAAEWLARQDACTARASVHGKLPTNGPRAFATFFDAHASPAADDGDERVLVVGGPDLPNGSANAVPPNWKLALRGLFDEAREDLRAAAGDLLARSCRQVVHLRVGDLLSFGFSHQAENVPSDPERVLARCEQLVREQLDALPADSKPLVVLSDCAALLRRLREQGDARALIVDGAPVHCRNEATARGGCGAAATSSPSSDVTAAADASVAADGGDEAAADPATDQETDKGRDRDQGPAPPLAPLDSVVRDALVLLGATDIKQFSCYAHGSLFVRLLATVAGASLGRKPLFSEKRHRCAGVANEGAKKAKRCARHSPRFADADEEGRWYCSAHGGGE